jgi:hypothetical protein
MMAFERTSSPNSLSPTTVEALRDALAQSVANGDHTHELRALLCNVAREARDKGIEAEHLLIMMKDIWYSLPDVSMAKSPDIATELLQDLISRCIQEYYAL